MSAIADRKQAHLDLAATGPVGFRTKTTLFEAVELVHEALPELSWGEIELATPLLGKTMRAPILIAAMTGGTDRAGAINRDLASLAEERQYALGLGSQRAMLKSRALLASYQVRDIAPTTLLFGNIGGVQAAQLSTDEAEDLVGSVGADALCIHLNPAQEMAQPEGDRDFRGVAGAIARLAQDASFPVIVKETGCGVSTATAKRLRSLGVKHVDVSGAGGTSWVGVETERGPTEQRRLGQLFWDWGIPTAASLLQVAPHGFDTVLATGGVTSGLDVARALALGAHAAGIARPVLQAHHHGGLAGAAAFLTEVERELRTALLLTGSASVSLARQAPYRLGEALAPWAPPMAGGDDQRSR